MRAYKVIIDWKPRSSLSNHAMPEFSSQPEEARLAESKTTFLAIRVQ